MKNGSFDLGMVGGLFIVCLFAVCMFMTLAFGSLIYSDVSDVMEQQYTVRTAAGYLTTRVRQGNADGVLEVGTFDGCEALVLREEYFEEVYVTYIYCWDGYLRELYCLEGEEFHASDGETVAAAEAVHFEIDGGLLRVTCSAGGREAVQYIQLTAREA